MNPIFLEAIVVCLGIVLLIAEAFISKGERKIFGYAGIAGLGVVFFLTFFVQPDAMNPEAGYSAYYSADAFAIFFKQFALISTILFLVMAIDYVPVIERYVPSATKGAGVGEFFAIPILTCAGLMWMVSATDFIVIFVALELVTISFYVLVAYLRRNPICLEAGTKYLILGALSTGFIVYGITWIFGVTGQTNLAAISEVLPELPADQMVSLLFGLALVLVAVGFKVAAFPFQFWIPDVYQGSPTPVAAYLSVASKAAGFVILLRILQPFYVLPVLEERLITVLGIIAGATIIYGNLAAIAQTNLKRLLSYSSIGHAGYLLMGVTSIGAVMAGPSIAFYLSAYLLMTFLAFMVVAIVARTMGVDDIVTFKGLGRRSPWLAGALLVAMLSLAGIPFTAGFLGKFMIFSVALSEGHFWLVGIGVITVAAGFYYYLKVVRAMYWQEAPEDAPEIHVSLGSKISMATLVALIFILGVYPQPILGLFL